MGVLVNSQMSLEKRFIIKENMAALSTKNFPVLYNYCYHTIAPLNVATILTIKKLKVAHILPQNFL